MPEKLFKDERFDVHYYGTEAPPKHKRNLAIERIVTPERWTEMLNWLERLRIRYAGKQDAIIKVPHALSCASILFPDRLDEFKVSDSDKDLAKQPAIGLGYSDTRRHEVFIENTAHYADLAMLFPEELPTVLRRDFGNDEWLKQEFIEMVADYKTPLGWPAAIPLMRNNRLIQPHDPEGTFLTPSELDALFDEYKISPNITDRLKCLSGARLLTGDQWPGDPSTEEDWYDYMYYVTNTNDWGSSLDALLSMRILTADSAKIEGHRIVLKSVDSRTTANPLPPARRY